MTDPLSAGVDAADRPERTVVDVLDAGQWKCTDLDNPVALVCHLSGGMLNVYCSVLRGLEVSIAR